MATSVGQKKISSGAVLHVFDVMSTNVQKVNSSDSLYKTVRKLVGANVGCIVVMKNEDVAGIITKGDILKRAFLKGLKAKEVSVARVMSKPVLTVSPDASLEETSSLMTAKNVSKLPVVRDEKLVGIVTATDLIRAEPMEVNYLQELIRARFVPHDLR